MSFHLRPIQNAVSTGRGARGFAIVSAIFLLVALAALGAFMVMFSNTQHLSSAQDIQGSRAYWAAKGGVQWAAGFIIANGGVCPASPSTPAFGDGFTVTVTCSDNTYREGQNRRVYRIIATATAGGPVGSLNYIERQVQAFIDENLP